MVACVILQNMRQDRDEPIRAFAARVRGQANVCNFKVEWNAVNCENEVDYIVIQWYVIPLF